MTQLSHWFRYALLLVQTEIWLLPHPNGTSALAAALQKCGARSWDTFGMYRGAQLDALSDKCPFYVVVWVV